MTDALDLNSDKSRELAKDWLEQIDQAISDFKVMSDKCDKIIKTYRDERITTDGGVDTNRRLNLFWSNIETMKPAIYSKCPQAIVERRYLDKDTVGRVASQILERALRYEIPTSGYDHTLHLCRDDYLLVGRGIPWVRYNPEFGEPISPDALAKVPLEGEQTENIEAKDDEKVDAETRLVERESLCVDYVYWKDWIPLGRPRVWSELMGCARRVYMIREDLIEKFGKKIGKAIPLVHAPGNKEDGRLKDRTQDRPTDQAEVFEIWDKQARKVWFVARSYDRICLEMDGLGLEGFWPFPRPAMTNTTNGTLTPVPDFLECQDQYRQINDLTRRIDVLTDACRVAGLYDASNKDIARIFTEATEPTLIAVDNWAMFSDKGGLKGQIDFVPLDLIAKTLEILIKTRKEIIDDVYQVTGISDIMRGATDPNETMGAQKLKQQNGYGRLNERQEDYARMARDTIAIMGEIICEHFDAKTLLEVSSALQDDGLIPSEQPQGPPQAPQMGHNGGPPMQGPMPPQNPGVASPLPPVAPPNGVQQPQPMPPGMAAAPIPDPMAQKMELIAQAIELLKNEKLRGFRIDIETDSTIQPDQQQDKAAVTEFMAGVTKYLETAGQIAMQMPEATPMLGKMLLWGVRRFRVGRDLEASIEEFSELAMEKAKQLAANPPPNPEEIKAKTEQMKANSEIQRQQLENEGEAFNSKMDLESKQIDLEMRKIELEMKRIEHNQKTHESNMSLAETAIGAGGEAKEGGGDSVHPHVMAAKFSEAADKFLKAAEMNNKPKKITHSSGKTSVIEPIQ